MNQYSMSHSNNICNLLDRKVKMSRRIGDSLALLATPFSKLIVGVGWDGPQRLYYGVTTWLLWQGLQPRAPKATEFAKLARLEDVETRSTALFFPSMVTFLTRISIRLQGLNFKDISPKQKGQERQP